MKIIEKLKKYLKEEMNRLDDEYIREEKDEDMCISHLIRLENYFDQTEKILRKLEELEDEEILEPVYNKDIYAQGTEEDEKIFGYKKKENK